MPSERSAPPDNSKKLFIAARRVAGRNKCAGERAGRRPYTGEAWALHKERAMYRSVCPSVRPFVARSTKWPPFNAC